MPAEMSGGPLAGFSGDRAYQGALILQKQPDGKTIYHGLYVFQAIDATGITNADHSATQVPQFRDVPFQCGRPDFHPTTKILRSAIIEGQFLPHSQNFEQFRHLNPLVCL